MGCVHPAAPTQHTTEPALVDGATEGRDRQAGKGGGEPSRPSLGGLSKNFSVLPRFSCKSTTDMIKQASLGSHITLLARLAVRRRAEIALSHISKETGLRVWFEVGSSMARGPEKKIADAAGKKTDLQETQRRCRAICWPKFIKKKQKAASFSSQITLCKRHVNASARRIRHPPISERLCKRC